MSTGIIGAVIATVLIAPAAQTPSPAVEAETCRELVRRDPNNGANIYRAGLCFEAVRDLVGAANAFRQAIDLRF